MSLAGSFEELRIWQEARVLVRECYAAFGKRTLAQCDPDFRSQIQQAALSVMNNIAEGFERKTAADFARFLDIAKGSTGEVRSMMYAAEDLGYLKPERSAEFREEAKALSRGIAALAKHLRK